MSVFTRGPYVRLAVVLNTLSSINKEIIIIITSPSPTPKIRVPSGEQLVPLLTTLVCRGQGSNPVPPDLEADTLPTELPRPVDNN